MSGRMVAVGFIAALYGAVLGFGGTHPLVLAVVEGVIFLITVAAIWSFGTNLPERGSGLPWALLILAWVAVQWLMLTESRAVIAQHVPRLLAYLCSFYLAFHFGQERKLGRALVTALLALGAIEALYGLAQYLLNAPNVLLYRSVYFGNRATGTYINPNHFAGLLEMVLPLSLGLTLNGMDRMWGLTGRGLQRLGAESESAPRLVFYFLFSLFLFAGILASGSRMGIFGALAGMGAVILVWATASWRAAKVIPALIVLLIAMAGLGLWLGLETVLERYGETESAYLLRVSLWKDSLPLIAERPILGWGLGNFANAYTKHQTAALALLVDHAHNDYLEFAVELGLVGAVLLFGLVLTGLLRVAAGIGGIGSTRDRYLLLGCVGSVVAILVHGIADFNLQIPANALLFATILGLALGIQSSSATVKHRTEGEEAGRGALGAIRPR